MMNFAVVKDNEVVNIVVFSNVEDAENFDLSECYGEGAYAVEINSEQTVRIGDSYTEGNFVFKPLSEK